jgi:tripartite-type tricarboxylate transporter receptor subunit TctC
MIAIATALLATTAPVAAQNWPAHRITLVVPFAAGGSSDVIARIAADGISNNLHQPVIVENVAQASAACSAAPAWPKQHPTAMNS